ncbi:MAG TPA: tetratricopeptide repeat protein [Ktedonobacteraceae bacterium]
METDRISALMNKGTSLDSLGKPDEALSYFNEVEQALRLSEKGREKTAFEFMLAYNRAIAYENLADYEASLPQWDKAAKLAEQIPPGNLYLSSTPPDKTSALLGKALTLAKSGELDLAMEICKEVLSLQPDNKIAISRMGYLFLRAKQYEEAISWCTRALQIDERDMHSLANLGAALLGVGRVEEARSALQQALDLAPTHPPALYSMGTLLLQNGSPDQAIHYLQKAVAINPRFSEAWNHLGLTLIQASQPGSRECFEKALRTDPNNTMALANLAHFFQEEQGCSSEEALACALVSVGFYESKLQVASMLFTTGAFAEALSLFDKLPSDKAHNLEAQLGKAACLHRLGRSHEAIIILEAMIGEEPDNFMACHNLGAILAEIGDLKRATFYYKRALRIDSQHAETWCKLAALLYQSDPSKRAKEALSCLEKAIRLRSDLAQAHGVRGRILDDLNRNAQALDSYDRALALSPGMSGEMFGRGLVLLKLGRYIEAAAAFEELYQLDPSCAQAVANQVTALAIAGEIERAHIVLQQALHMHPNDRNLIMCAAQLQRNTGNGPLQ